MDRGAQTQTQTHESNQNENQNGGGNGSQNQNQKRTRSQLALPAFNVEYDRSPLKFAREAVKRANARLGPERMADRVREIGVWDVANRNEGASGMDEERELRVDDGPGTFIGRSDGVEDVKMAGKVGSEGLVHDGGASSLPRNEADNPFDFSVNTVEFHPKPLKRPRSSSFDQVALSHLSSPPPRPPQPVTNVPHHISPSLRSPGLRFVQLDSHDGDDEDGPRSDVPLSISDSATSTSGSSNPKRAKIAGRGTLDAFFTRSNSSSSATSSDIQDKQPKALPSRPGTSRRIFSAVSQPDSVSTPLAKGTGKLLQKNNVGEESSLFPKTPTIKELRAIPSLDLRTVTPSPRKRALQLGYGTPGVKVRAVSEGAALSLGESESADVESKRSTTEHPEHVNDMVEPRGLSLSRPNTPRRSVSLASGKEVERPSMDVDFHPKKQHSNEEPPLEASTEQVPPEISISTSSSTTLSCSSGPESISQRLTIEPSDLASNDMKTPTHKILPSRPLPSGHLPSAKNPLSKLLSLSPLTPLSSLDSMRHDSDEYDYEEEERSVQKETRNADRGKEAAKLAMQQEGEGEVASELGAPSRPVSKKPTSQLGPSSRAPPTAPNKASSKGKHKGKVLSSASRVVTGAAGVKKRKSLVSATSMTPRMRLTRATVLRQKAVQAQMRTPKEGKAKTTLFGTKSSSTKAGLDVADGEVDGKKIAKEDTKLKAKGGISGQKHSKVQPQRSPRKSFVLTVPSSLSPRKSSSVTSSSNSSLTLKSAPAFDSEPSKQFTFSLYPPAVNDVAATERAQLALSKLSSALDKLAMPPPSKPASRGGLGGDQLRRPASEQRERIRPATSLGFTREMSVPVSGTSGGAKRLEGRPRASSRAGSVGPRAGQVQKSGFPPPPPPAFGSSLMKGKARAPGSASRTAPVSFGLSNSKADGGNEGQMHPPSSFRFGLGGPSAGMSRTSVFGRPIPRMRASQKTSLETVQGSPVRGGAAPQAFLCEEEDEIVNEDPNEKDEQQNLSATSVRTNGNGDTSISSTEGGDVSGVEGANGTTTGSGKELKRISKLNASRRASMAFSALSESLRTSPELFSPLTAQSPADVRDLENARSPADALTSSRPVRAAAPRTFRFGYAGLGRTQSETAVNPRSRSVTPLGFSESDSEGGRSGAKKSGGGGSMGRTKMPGSLDVLDQCTIFVDVRTEEGEDAGALFVDMLRGLGAKVLSRVGQTCTHIVYKNGLASTLTRYRLLDEPRPSVVGIGWVVECVEKRARVDETRFQVDLEGVNVAGALKRRRSFLPKQITSSLYAAGPMDAFLNGSTGAGDATSNAVAAHPVPRACMDSDPVGDGDMSQERPMLSGGGLNSNIAPLERARRRSIMIPR